MHMVVDAIQGGDEMTKITTYIDERLLNQAVKETNCHSQREVLEAGLRSLMADVRARRFSRDLKTLRLGVTMRKVKWSRGSKE